MRYGGNGKAIALTLNPGVEWPRAAQCDMSGPMPWLRPGMKLNDVFTLIANPLHQGINACVRYFVITHRNPPFRGNTSENDHYPSDRLLRRYVTHIITPSLLFRAMAANEVTYFHYCLYNIQTAFVKRC